MTGSQSRESFTPGQTSDSSSNTRGKSRMHQRARTDPSGGRGATRVPTGTRAMTFVLVIPREGRVYAGLGRQIGCCRCDGLAGVSSEEMIATRLMALRDLA